MNPAVGLTGFVFSGGKTSSCLQKCSLMTNQFYSISVSLLSLFKKDPLPHYCDVWRTLWQTLEPSVSYYTHTLECTVSTHSAAAAVRWIGNLLFAYVPCEAWASADDVKAHSSQFNRRDRQACFPPLFFLLSISDAQLKTQKSSWLLTEFTEVTMYVSYDTKFSCQSPGFLLFLRVSHTAVNHYFQLLIFLKQLWLWIVCTAHTLRLLRWKAAATSGPFADILLVTLLTLTVRKQPTCPEDVQS